MSYSFRGYFKIRILTQFHKNNQNRHFKLGLQNFQFRYWDNRVGPRFDFLIHIMFGMKKHNLVSRLAGGGIAHSYPAGFDQIYVVYLSWTHGIRSAAKFDRGRGYHRVRYLSILPQVYENDRNRHIEYSVCCKTFDSVIETIVLDGDLISISGVVDITFGMKKYNFVWRVSV